MNKLGGLRKMRIENRQTLQGEYSEKRFKKKPRIQNGLEKLKSEVKKKREGKTYQCFLPSLTNINVIGNITPAETEKQRFLVVPPSCTRKLKPPEDCNVSFIDQIQNGFYSSSKLIRNVPQKTSDSYFVIKTRATSVRSYRRNYSHKSIALYRTKKEGPTRANIEYMTCSFLELDGSTDNSIKTIEDVQALAKKNNLLEGLQITQTSPGHFHVIWTYSRPLPFTSKGESYWISQQKKLIELFQKSGFDVDYKASTNPTQNLRNPSQLNAYNFKRKCEVFIHSSYRKTSLRRLYEALNGTDIPNPKKILASVKLKRDLRQNKTFITTHKAYAKKHGVSERTMRTEITRAIANGDLQIVRKTGNNKRFTRATEYISNLYLEPNSQNGNTSSIKTNSVQTEGLLRDFKQKGTKVGRRQKALFALGLFLKAKLGKQASKEAIRAELGGGAMRCHVSERELERTLQNVMKPIYDHPMSLSKLQDWDLLEGTKYFH